MAKREIILDIKVNQDEANKRLAELVVELQKQREELKQLNTAYKQGLISEEEFGAQSVKLAKDIRALQQEQRDLQRSVDLSDKAFSDQGDTLVQLRAQLGLLTKSYDNLSAEERDTTEAGQALERQIKDLSTQILNLEEATGRSQRNVGNYKSAFEGIRGEFGSLIGSIAGPAGVLFALDSVGDAVNNGVQYVNEITEKFRDFRGQVQLLSGETGEPLDNLTSKIQAVAQTFGKDFNEVLIATNATAKQFGIETDQALNLIQDGFLAGADVSGQFLDQLEEYPAQLKSVGLNAEESIAIITQQVTEGIFSDKGIDTIKEAGLRLRELTPATREALEGIGLSADEVEKSLSDGSKTLFDVIQDVSTKLNELPENTKEVGTAIADIFGGPGEDAGLAYIKTLKDIDGGLSSLIDPTNELTAARQRELQVQRDLAAAQNELSKIFAENQNELSLLRKEGEVFLVKVLLEIINTLKPVVESLKSFSGGLSDAAESLGFVSAEGEKVNVIVSLIGKAVDVALIPFKALVETLDTLTRAFNSAYEGSTIFKSGIDFVADTIQNLPAIFAGVGEAITQAFENTYIRPIKSFAVEVQLQFANLKKAIGIGDAVQEDIDKLNAQKAEFAKTGRTVSEAFKAGFESVKTETPAVISEEVVTQAAEIGTQTGAAFAGAVVAETETATTSIKNTIELASKLQEEASRRKIALIELELLAVERGSKRELELQQQLLSEKTTLTLQSSRLLAEEELLLIAETEAKKKQLTSEFVNTKLQESKTALAPIRAQLEEELSIRALFNEQRRVQEESKNIELLDLDEEYKKQVIENAEEIAEAQKLLDEEERERKRDTLQAAGQLAGQLSEFAKKTVTVEEQIAEKQQELSRTTSEVRREEIRKEIETIRESGKVEREETIASKGLAIADATINTYLAATKALAQVPVPANFIVAAAITASGLINVAKIAGIGGFAEGGETGTDGIPDPQLPGRKITGVVHDNEYVTPHFVLQKPQAKPHIAALESLRISSLPSFAVGGFTTSSDITIRESITNLETSLQVNEQFLQAVKNISPVVEVTEITRMQNRVKTKENYGSL